MRPRATAEKFWLLDPLVRERVGRFSLGIMVDVLDRHALLALSYYMSCLMGCRRPAAVGHRVRRTWQQVAVSFSNTFQEAARLFRSDVLLPCRTSPERLPFDTRRIFWKCERTSNLDFLTTADRVG
jgi:hypothetical protein